MNKNLIKSSSNIYFTSDDHFNHENIIKYCNRPFVDAEAMNETLINNWNEIVNATDEIYHLGDFGFGKPDQLVEIMKRLNGKIYFIKGNHDKNTMKANKKCGRFEWVKEQFDLKIEDDEIAGGLQRIVLNHYPMIVWNHSHHGSWNLYGHIHLTHDKIQPLPGFKTTQLDIGVDYHDFYPISYEDVKIMITKQCLK